MTDIEFNYLYTRLVYRIAKVIHNNKRKRGNIMAFLYALPGAIAEGLIWGLMGIGVYISYKILDIADLTVDGSICTGACVPKIP